MNDQQLARTALCDLLRDHGERIVEDAARCEALLRDLCPRAPREVNLLVVARKAGVPAQLKTTRQGDLPAAVVARLGNALEHQYGLTPAAARWAVEAWAAALRLPDYGAQSPMTFSPPNQPASQSWPTPQGPAFQPADGGPEVRSLLANLMPWLCFGLLCLILLCEWLSFFAGMLTGRPFLESWTSGGSLGTVTMSGAAVCAFIAITVARWPAAVHLGWLGLLFGMLALLFGVLLIQKFATMQSGVEVPVPVGMLPGH